MRWLAIFTIVIASAVRAQTHVPLFDEPTRVWTSTFSGTVDARCSDTWTTSFWLSGDTIINGTTYQKVLSRGLYHEGYINAPPNTCTTSYFFTGETRFVREVGRKVYARHSNTSEKLIYDFTADVGDTIPFPFNVDGHDDRGVVSAIDSVEVNGTYRKRFIIPGIPGYGTGIPHVIEGIGGCRGVFQELYGQIGLSHFTNLNCVVEHGSPIYGEGGCPLYTRVESAVPIRPIGIAPNPSTGQFTISGMDRTCYWEVFDTQGNLVKRMADDRIDLSGAPSGLYHLRIRSPQGQSIGSHRLVILR